MRVALVVRPDHATKPGGDIVQAKAYGTWLQGAGHEVVLGPVDGQVLGCDVALLFNLDLISEFVRNARVLAAAGRPYVPVPIHHPWEWLDRFERIGRTGALGASNRLFRSPAARDRARDIARSGIGAKLRWHAVNRRCLVGQAADALAGAAHTVYIADGERRHVERDFGIAPPGTVVRNGITPQPAARSSAGGAAHRDVDVVVVGRIEERKNQVHLARALAGTGLRVVFAGHVSPANKRYADRLLDIVGKSPDLEFVGQLPPPEMAAMLARSKVSASASWVEVASLVDIEAHVAGAGVVASARGFTAEYGIAGLRELSPEDSAERLRQVCLEAVGAWQPPTETELCERSDAHAWSTTLAPLGDVVAAAAG
jgi:glycosyltransferase involved in cell wall biosynthesis